MVLIYEPNAWPYGTYSQVVDATSFNQIKQELTAALREDGELYPIHHITDINSIPIEENITSTTLSDLIKSITSTTPHTQD